MTENKLKEMLEKSSLLFYGDIEPLLDKFLPEFFSVDVSDISFSKNHQMNTLEFWFTVSWLVEMDCLEYGTSPRGAWLTEKGEALKKYIMSTSSPVTHLIYEVKEDYE